MTPVARPTLPPDLLAVLGSLTDPEALELVFSDLLSPAEIETLRERWAIIKRLDAGASQRAVAAEIGSSVTTVSRGARQLKYGAGGFRLALDLAVELSGSEEEAP